MDPDWIEPHGRVIRQLDQEEQFAIGRLEVFGRSESRDCSRERRDEFSAGLQRLSLEG